MSYAQDVLAKLTEKNSNEPEFLQAATEVLSSIAPVIEKHPEYDRDISISIGNLSRLGIIYIPNRNMGTVRFDGDQSLVTRFKETDYFRSMYKDEVLTHVDVASYKAYITEFGLTFRQLAFGV